MLEKINVGTRDELFRRYAQRLQKFLGDAPPRFECLVFCHNNFEFQEVSKALDSIQVNTSPADPKQYSKFANPADDAISQRKVLSQRVRAGCRHQEITRLLRSGMVGTLVKDQLPFGVRHFAQLHSPV